jgi:thymidylate synthase ThyX
VNRILEPFAHINVVVTATDWNNFFDLRDHEDAEPHVRMLAQAMRAAMDGSKPRSLWHGERHLPYAEDGSLHISEALRVSAARCARVSYLTHDQRMPSVEEDLALADRLMKQEPMHASPLEHQAHAMMDDDRWANLRGWQSWRHFLETGAPARPVVGNFY